MRDFAVKFATSKQDHSDIAKFAKSVCAREGRDVPAQYAREEGLLLAGRDGNGRLCVCGYLKADADADAANVSYGIVAPLEGWPGAQWMLLAAALQVARTQWVPFGTARFSEAGYEAGGSVPTRWATPPGDQADRSLIVRVPSNASARWRVRRAARRAWKRAR